MKKLLSLLSITKIKKKVSFPQWRTQAPSDSEDAGDIKCLRVEREQ